MVVTVGAGGHFASQRSCHFYNSHVEIYCSYSGAIFERVIRLLGTVACGWMICEIVVRNRLMN